MTAIALQLLDAARKFDNTMDGAEGAETIIGGIDAPAHVVAAESAKLARRVAGKLNTPEWPGWDERDDDEADQTLDEALDGIHDGGRRVGPNISLAADRAMTALVQLARERDDAERLSLAKLYTGSVDPLKVAFVGIQLVRALADWTGDPTVFFDAVTCQLMETARPTQQEES